ncbi:hypothetical protein Ciccas_004905 [Cichlidogyrus casuarinus]|uniref:TFG box profile domain-containing protein n=1 Tax=Cichlidogyrus casuarinus TaxID=1844966 RepID=A0ABD2QDP1_9PLAT
MSEGIGSVLGAKVNIISKARIRYEGILIKVDTEKPDDPAITLSNVISHGTENRPTERFIPPKPGTYERITFSGKDLEDISLVAPEEEDVPNDDPSILSSGPSSQLPPAIGTPKAHNSYSAVSAQKINPSPIKNLKNSESSVEAHNDFFDNSHPHNDEDDEEGQEHEASQSQGGDAFGGGFFDNLSCEIIDKANGVSTQSTNRRNERKLNADTFGTSAFYDGRRNFSGGYRGRGGYNRRGGNGGGGFRGGRPNWNNPGYQQNGNWRHPSNFRQQQGFTNRGQAVPEG